MADESENKALFKAMVGNLSRVVSNQAKQTKQLTHVKTLKTLKHKNYQTSYIYIY